MPDKMEKNLCQRCQLRPDCVMTTDGDWPEFLCEICAGLSKIQLEVI
jgi:hypothetical protein